MRTSRYFIIAVVALLSASCAQENLIDLNRETTAQPVSVTFTATMEDAVDTRTGLKDDTRVVWTKGDAVALFTASTKDRFNLVSGENTGNAAFGGTTSGTAPFYALYPYSDDCSLQDGIISFKVPSRQTYVAGSFAQGVSPALAKMTDLSAGTVFKNLFGILQVNLCGSGKIKGVEVVDLAGNMLWGECRLALDGKEGTSEQTLTVTGGDNKLYMEFEKEVALLRSTPRVLNFVVPAGSMSKGFSVRVFDITGKAVSFLTAQNPAVVVSRSNITAMEKVTAPDNGELLDTLGRGYYKELFMDGGSYVTSRTTLPAVPYLGWEMDFMATDDSVFQRSIVIKNDIDNNGFLLYPDNAPRYRMIYCNGGKAGAHGRSLTSTGRSRYKKFVANGGAYVGSCAGAFLASYGTSEGSYNTNYLAIYPGPMFSSGLTDSYTGMFIPKNSHLLDHYNYGNDFYVDSVRHNGGGYVTEATLPQGGEILALFDRPDKKMHNNGSIWAYKADKYTGRVVTTGSHPEGVSSGERRDLMAAMVLYATEGNGPAVVKASLENGVTRDMDKGFSASDPDYACIGDGQYHHFTMDIPDGAKNVKVELHGPGDTYDLYLAVRRERTAWLSDADYFIVRSGSNKTLQWDTLPAGKWYIGVYCAEKVTTECALDKFECSGTTEALNGIPYYITASWN
ncbi:MAG: hypothetical protein J5699_08075 [Bacteroidales bacterium]|nr:hypothetical protein [Bacteroidales bacterium]